MARGGINRRGLQKELSVKLGPIIKKNIEKRAKREVNAVVRRMLVEFNSHPVTREIEGGVGANNISGTLGGNGNLFSFIGFDSGDRPIAPVRQILEQSTRLVSVTQKSGDLLFTVVIDIPDKDKIFRATPLPWAAARSWVAGIEQGLSGLGQFVVKSGAGRSRGGVQVGGRLRGGSFSNKKYISEIINNLQENLLRALRK
tara:strand:- start:4256 stop:4855 length:600 start_codon:yes stop_codon:yes gene_type:complete